MRWSVRELVVALTVVGLGACEGPPSSIGGTEDSDAAPLVDAPLPDAPPATLGPALVFDDLHIAGFMEEAHSFSVLGQVVNPQLQGAIDDGTLLLGIELRQLDDPGGQNDEDMTVGLYSLQDTDEDPTDNFDPDAPERFELGPGAVIMDEPSVHFTEASIEAGQLHAVGANSLGGGLPLPLPLRDPELEGVLEPTEAGDGVRILSDGRLRGTVPADLLALAPNALGDMCPGDTMLDVLVGGCGFGVALQPDVDVDGDGLETFHDDHGSGDAGPGGDGRVDRCVDGDGTEILGEDCPMDERIQDGYRLIFVVHGVRAVLLE